MLEGALDHQGPSIHWRSPIPDQIRSYYDSIIPVRLEVFDSSSISIVQIGDSTAYDSSGVWCGRWILPVSEIGTPLTIRARDRHDNVTDSTYIFIRKSKPTLGPPEMNLIHPSPGTLVPTEEDSTEVIWRVVIPNGVVNKVWINDRPAIQGIDGQWSTYINLPASGRPIIIPLRVVDTNKLESRSFAMIGRHRDTIGPSISWADPIQLFKYPYYTVIANVLVKTSDPSGIDSLQIDGSPAIRIGEEWSAPIMLGVPGSETPFRISSWDKAGNRTDSILHLIRAELPPDIVPSFHILNPTRKTGYHAPWDSSSMWIRWIVSDFSGIDSSTVRINNQPAVRENDSTWGLKIPLAPLKRLYIPITATNRKGNSQADVVEITRDGDFTFPKIIKPEKTRDTVLFNDSVLSCTWSVSDNALESVRIGGASVSNHSGAFTFQAPVKPGLQWIYIEATDSSNNTSKDSIRVLSLPGMKMINGGDADNVFLYPDTHSIPSEQCVQQIAYFDSLEGKYIQPPKKCTTQYNFIHFTLAQRVSISTFYILDHPINHQEYHSTNQSKPTINTNPNKLIDSISWYEAILFCNRQSIKFNLPPSYDTTSPDSSKWNLIDEAKGFRLPTFGELKIGNIQDSGHEWTHEWVKTNFSPTERLTDPLGPISGKSKMHAILPDVTMPDLGLSPQSQLMGLGFRIILPANAWAPQK